MALLDWAPRVLSPEDKNPTKTIQLTAEGTVWETWSEPFPAVDEFLTTAGAVVAAFADECPKRRIPILFTALDAQGAIKSQCPSSVQGKNAQADALAGSGNGAAKAFADAMAGISATMNTILKAAQTLVENTMRANESVTKANESLTEQICDLRDWQKAKQEAEIAEKATDTGVNDFILEQLKGGLPMALHAAELWLESRKVPAAAKAVAAATNGALKTS